ncbi:MAG: hypothetical protein IID49_06215, partial [Proteobacteria bacterium]|nr:hypothetical protein [Pseudomonadota bacterium]
MSGALTGVVTALSPDPPPRGSGGRNRRRGALGGLVAALWLALPAAAAGLPGPLIETPALAGRVAAGELPPVAERVPDEPLVVDLAARKREPGLHGGTLRMFVTRS